METIFKYLFTITSIAGIAIKRATHNLDFESISNDKNLQEILENPENKKRVDDAIERLKKSGDKHEEDVILTNNEKLTISIS